MSSANLLKRITFLFVFRNTETSLETPTVFIHQSAWQQRMMCRYGNLVTLIDATYNTNVYNLPLFMLCVPTNCLRGGGKICLNWRTVHFHSECTSNISGMEAAMEAAVRVIWLLWSSDRSMWNRFSRYDVQYLYNFLPTPSVTPSYRARPYPTRRALTNLKFL